MPQSLSKVYIHFIFSVKNRKKLISNNVKEKLHSYMIGTIKNLGSYVEEIYANPDHIHILCTLPRTIPIADFVSKIKSSSSKWIKTQNISDFSWQSSYGVFSVSSSKINIVKKHILNQSEHHKTVSFKEEYILFLKEYNIKYNEQYVWD